MNAKNRWLLGLQWGASVWLAYVAWGAAREFYDLFYYPGITHLFDLWPSWWWTPVYLLLFPGWLAAVALLVMGSRRARPAVAVMILARVAVACVEWHSLHMAEDGAQLVVPLLLPLLPLVVLRVEEPRVVLALAALGRFREALARSGGVVALLVALTLLSTRHAAHQALAYQCDLPTACGVTIILTALAALATLVTWATHQRRARA